MAMRLLSKTEVTKAKATERQREVQEGLKVARRVDALRETAAQEEKALEKFRSETIESINKEIAEVENQKRTKEKELRLIEEKAASELHKIEQAQKELDASMLIYSAIDQKQKEQQKAIQSKEEQADQILKAAEKTNQEANKIKAAAEAIEADAAALFEEAKTREAATIRQESESLLLAKKKEKELAEREAQLQLLEMEIQKSKQKLEEKEATIIFEMQKMREERATVNRIFERFQKLNINVGKL